MSETVVVVSPEGGVELPFRIRAALKWDTGTRLVVERTSEGVLLRQAGKEAYFPATRIEDVMGILKYDGPPVSVEEMNLGIASEVRRRHDRGRY